MPLAFVAIQPPSVGNSTLSGFVPHHYTVFPKFGHDVPAYGSRLNACQLVFLVDPENAIHACHIDGRDHSLLMGMTPQRIRHVGSPAVWIKVTS